ncbi:hypothetical protein [Methylobacterium durans]|uniref:Uncharacterized protein n=1 Tax=Methylobacterium durans TaxID=2202825 RepID=A0A2U8W7K0_9HYPH|nr:hypothetical protein [Methylobacterium durans]AWN41286.1 hypothetical protein DK389_13130 [Methylobacterium durans]
MDPFAFIEAVLERPARPHLLSALDVFDIARRALMDAPGYDQHMRLEEQYQSADGCFTAFRIRDEVARGGARGHGISFVLAEAECLAEHELRNGLAAVMTKLVSRLLCERKTGREAAYA